MAPIYYELGEQNFDWLTKYFLNARFWDTRHGPGVALKLCSKPTNPNSAKHAVRHLHDIISLIHPLEAAF